MRFFAKGLVFLFVFALPVSLTADKSEKVYELIYKDIQLLKQTLLNLEKKIDLNREEMEQLKKEMRELNVSIKQLQLDQAGLKENQQNIPLQYQILAEKLDLVYQKFLSLDETVKDFKSISAPPPEASEEETPKKEEESPDIEKAESHPLPSDLSPQELFNMAREDYLKGHFDLAIEGFKIYKIHFPESPLADNASYWIGECLFSQQKFEEAVDQFTDVILNYPFSDKIAAAYLKKGLSLIQIGKKEEALATLKLLVSKYPLEEETKLAQEKIKELVEKK
ncbi:MAG: tol-pal system protein YbgF [Acidobacteriota bacterium]